MTQNIAIIGSNHSGEIFYNEMTRLKRKGINVVCVYNRAGLDLNSMAETAGIKRLSIEEIVDLGEDLDVIFDLSGNTEIRAELRKTLFSSRNQHTVIAPESVAQVMWAMISDEKLPGSDGKLGY